MPNFAKRTGVGIVLRVHDGCTPYSYIGALNNHDVALHFTCVRKKGPKKMFIDSTRISRSGGPCVVDKVPVRDPLGIMSQQICGELE